LLSVRQFIAQHVATDQVLAESKQNTEVLLSFIGL
jgi:hypothetical protein